MKKKWNPLLLVAALWIVISLFCWLKPEKDISDSERRKLASFPNLTWSSVMNGSFMEKFDSAATDQFPFREGFRTLKALFSTCVWGQKDNHDIISYEGYLEKLNGPVSESSLQKAADKLTAIYETYFSDSDVYFAVVPEKGHFIPDQAGYPLTDFDAILELELLFSKKIDITGTLSLEDYYHTDSHWRQECLADTAQTLANAMGVTLSGKYTTELLTHDFLGVYAGQSALPCRPEPIYCLRNEVLDGCTVYNHETGKSTTLYDPSNLENRDPYDVFLDGAVSLLTIENPASDTGRELIVFRDSFGSSLIPLLCEGYDTVTVVDIRYLPSAKLGDFIDFHGQDVLLLYSTGILNNSSVLR